MKLPNIDGESVSKSIGVVVDRIRYRKYAKKGFTLVVWINKENTLVKLLDGHIRDELLEIPSQDEKKIINKVYIAPSKKIVTRLCFVKEDINNTLDITINDTSKISTELFKRFVNIKILDDLQSFNMGQVLLGAAVGTFIGFLLCLGTLMMYGMFL
jgi:hypothetical protein